MRMFRFAPLLLTLCFAAGCALVPLTPQPTTLPTPSSGAGDSLANTQWQLLSFGPPGAETAVQPGSTITLMFDAAGQAAGQSGCNSYGGGYQVQDGMLSFGQFASTLMACADEQVMQQEQGYLLALQAAGRFEQTADRLTIWYDNEAGVLNFAPASAVATPTAAASPTASGTPTPAASPTTGAAPGDDTPADATRINFAPGETAAVIEAEIEERGSDFYVLRALAGQSMSVEISSPNNDVLLSVVGEDGTPYKRYQNGPPSWTGELPLTQDYFLHAVSVGPATPYILRVHVEPLGSEPPSSGSPERVEFAPGEVSATRSGDLPPGSVKEYVLAAMQGQRMHVQTIGYNAPVAFTVRSPGGATWSGEALGSEVYIFAGERVLPESGDYLVTLSTPADAATTRYDVVFTIDATPPMAPQPGPPERVAFEPGAISAQRGGLQPSGPGVTQYVLAAAAGQTMTVDLTSDDVPLAMTIEGPGGMQWIPEPAFGEDFVTSFTFPLPETGDYLVTLTKGDHTPSTNFEITFTIQ